MKRRRKYKKNRNRRRRMGRFLSKCFSDRNIRYPLSILLFDLALSYSITSSVFSFILFASFSFQLFFLLLRLSFYFFVGSNFSFRPLPSFTTVSFIHVFSHYLIFALPFAYFSTSFTGPQSFPSLFNSVPSSSSSLSLLPPSLSISFLSLSFRSSWSTFNCVPRHETFFPWLKVYSLRVTYLFHTLCTLLSAGQQKGSSRHVCQILPVFFADFLSFTSVGKYRQISLINLNDVFSLSLTSFRVILLLLFLLVVVQFI